MTPKIAKYTLCFYVQSIHLANKIPPYSHHKVNCPSPDGLTQIHGEFVGDHYF